MEDEQLVDQQTFDMSALQPVEHNFDHIVGNELRCSLHGSCNAIFVRPTQVLERNEQGELMLVDKG